jgi:hypothetical protein
MQAIEFEATAFQQTIRIPEYIPDGVKFQVLLLIDDTETNNESDIFKHWQSLFSDQKSPS